MTIVSVGFSYGLLIGLLAGLVLGSMLAVQSIGRRLDRLARQVRSTLDAALMAEVKAERTCEYVNDLHTLVFSVKVPQSLGEEPVGDFAQVHAGGTNITKGAI